MKTGCQTHSSVSLWEPKPWLGRVNVYGAKTEGRVFGASVLSGLSILEFSELPAASPRPGAGRVKRLQWIDTGPSPFPLPISFL